MTFLDVIRRLSLSSFLLFFENQADQILFALVVSVVFVVLYREIHPYWVG